MVRALHACDDLHSRHAGVGALPQTPYLKVAGVWENRTLEILQATTAFVVRRLMKPSPRSIWGIVRSDFFLKFSVTACQIARVGAVDL